MMTDLEDFLPQVLTIAPGCPEPTATSALREAAIRFCEATRIWRSEDEYEVTADNCSCICVPDQAELFEIEQVTFNGMTLEPASLSYLDRICPTWRAPVRLEDGELEDEITGSPRYFTQERLDSIRIVPNATGLVTVHAFLKPAEDAEQVPEFLFKKYKRIIASGALEDILLMPGQPFFNPDLSSVHAARFRAALDRNFNLNVRGQQRAPTRTRSQFL